MDWKINQQLKFRIFIIIGIMIILAIHGGCGTFNEQIEKSCSSALKSTTKKGGKQEEESQLVQAIMELEKCPSLNCGIGSNLTEIGTVECEAAFICSTNMAFGAVASVTNCAHPIYAAAKLANSHRHQNSNSNQLIEPMILVGPGADEYCRRKSIGIVKNEQLITEAANKEYNRAKSIVANNENSSSTNCNGDLRLDTVGGVLINMANGYAEAGVSSGGILLKKCGRLGHSPHFGAAIWAEQRGPISIAISLSGCGEAIIRTQMAEKLAQFMFESDLDNPFLPELLQQFLDSNFLNSARLSTFSRDRLLLGGLLLIKNGQNIGLMAFHNTRHFPFAFVRINQRIGKIKSETDKCGEFVCISMNL